MMEHIFLFVFLAGACFCQAPPASPGGEDVYVLNFDSPVYVCPDEVSQGFVDSSGMELQRYNETTSYMTGSVNFLKGLGEFTMVELLVDREISGRLEMIVSHEICALCKEVGNPDSIYYKYLKYFGFPDKCPFEAGSYPVNDLKADEQDIPVRAETSGRYQVTVNLYDNPDGSCRNEKTFIGCLKVDFLIEPL